MKDFFFRLWLLAIVVTAPFPVAAHEAQSGMEYEAFCCNGDTNTGDCFQIPASSVVAGPQGYQVTLRPGDHPLVTEPRSWLVPYSESRPATDGNFHACLYPTQADMRCLYTPGMGF